MRVMLIRHGMTAGNAASLYIGRTDEPLCREGMVQAQNVEGDSGLLHVYVSPMLRAMETAQILFPNAEQTAIPDLREMDFGNFEGRSAEQMKNDPEYISWVDGMCRGICPGGESHDDFIRRTTAAFYAIVRKSRDDVTLVTHGGVIMAVMTEFAVPKREFYEWHVQNLGGYSAQVLFDGESLVLGDVKKL